ncbi:MAG: hypothetical protein QM535_20715 [Limnohabitans sp.]|nr:hypothetical protein [Limnohabitans sp.]
MSGKNFNLEKDSEILKINSPKRSVGGPYVVVYKNVEERWVIVALNWEKEPRLGIRWFWGNGGNPFSSANPIWLVIPSALTNSILNGLPLDFEFRNNLDKFFSHEIDGNKLKPFKN